MSDKKNNVNRSVERYIIGYVWIYGLFVALIMFLVDKFKLVLPISFLLGVFTSLLCFTMTIRCVDKLASIEGLDTRKELMKANGKKMLIYAAVLLVAGWSYSKRDGETIYLNIFATFAGLLSVKLMIYFKEFVIDKIFKNNPGKDVDAIITEDGKPLIKEQNEIDAKELEEKKKELEKLQKEYLELENKINQKNKIDKEGDDAFGDY